MGSYKEHQELLAKFKILVQDEIENVRPFDRHVGKFVLTRFFIDLKAGRCKIWDWKRYLITINRKGMADCYLLIPTKHGLIHVEVEAKSGKAIQKKEQKNWQRMIESIGGIYILLRDEHDALLELKGKLNGNS